MKYLSVFLGFILEPLLYLPLRGFTFFRFYADGTGKRIFYLLVMICVIWHKIAVGNYLSLLENKW